MKLRTKLLITFVTLGAAPLLVVGGVTNLRNQHAVEDLVTYQTSSVASRVSQEVGQRHAIRSGDLLFLAENTETLRLFGSGNIPPAFPGGPEPEQFLGQAWRSLGGPYRWIQFRNTRDEVILSLGDAPLGNQGEDRSGITQSNGLAVVLSEPIRDLASGQPLGSVFAALNPAAVFPADLGDRGFGASGWVAILSAETGRAVFHPQRAFLDQSVSSFIPDLPTDFDTGSGERATLDYMTDEEPWIASVVPIHGTPWTVLSASALDEFSLPFRAAARANSFLVLLITLVASGAFLVITLRTTRSLVALTTAAKEVSGGNLDPALPDPTGDEVGTLSGAFRIMLDRIALMIRQMEESRQLAAVGEFSAQIAHELRNPLTAIRMSIQGLYRRLADTEHGRPLEIALQETERLDRVARGVLSLGRRPQGTRTVVGVADLTKAAFQAVTPELEKLGVAMEILAPPEVLAVNVEEEAIRGALINLLRNAAEAMPDGGSISLSIGSPEGGSVEIHIVDDGPGIPPDLSSSIFDPFVTTKSRGNGFGLPLALKAAEAEGGTLRVAEAGEEKGAHFVLRLPLHEREGNA